MILPVLLSQNHRYKQCCKHSNQDNREQTFQLRFPLQEIYQRDHTKADPYRKSHKRTRIGIIPFPGFIGFLIKIKGNSKAGQEKKQYDHYVIPVILFQLEEEADQPEYQRKHEVFMRSPRCYAIGKVSERISHMIIINEWNAGDPVTVLYASEALYIILTS